MDKTIKQIQEEAEVAKKAIKSVLEDFMNKNPSVCLSGDFGVLKTFVSDIINKPLLVSSEIDITLNISIDEKSC